MSVSQDKLSAAREALDGHSWAEAFELLREADAEERLSPEWLEELGTAAWWTGRLDDCIDVRERAFAAYVAQGNQRKAAFVALRLAHNYQSKLGHSLETAWFKRAESLLDREDECVEHAYLARWRAAKAAARGDLDEALALAEHALDLGTRFGDKDVMALALHDLGRFRITKGEVEEGMGQLDEADARGDARRDRPIPDRGHLLQRDRGVPRPRGLQARRASGPTPPSDGASVRRSPASRASAASIRPRC